MKINPYLIILIQSALLLWLSYRIITGFNGDRFSLFMNAAVFLCLLLFLAEKIYYLKKDAHKKDSDTWT